MKIKMKYKSVLLFSLLFTACLSPLNSLGLSTANPRTSAPAFSWQETTYTYNMTRIWDGDSTILNYSNSYSKTFTTNDHYINESENTWTREINAISYQANYSFYSNRTIEGNLTLGLDLEVYQVNVQLEDAVNMIWIALKEGFLDMEYYRNSYASEFFLFEEYYQDVVSEYTKFDMTTWEVLDEWTVFSNESGTVNKTAKTDPSEYRSYTWRRNVFTQPLILTSQIYTTENGDKIAWAEMFYNYFIYNDTDKNGIYSVGVKEGGSIYGGMNLYTSDECRGSMNPIAENWQFYYEEIYPADPSSNWNLTNQINFPNDTAVSAIASTIEFTPPALDENNVIVWDIIYPQYPVYVSIYNVAEPYTNGGGSYDSLSPTDFSYEYAYNLTGNQANLDYTLGIGKIDKPEFYDAVQGFGLSIPRYNFFISSFDINEVDQIDITMPSSLFVFESNDTTIAEINMMNPIKKNYTLYDYPTNGVNTQMESMGGSLHRMVTASNEISAHSSDPILNLIYAIEEIVEADTTFTMVDKLYHLETQNYPLWNGEKLVHDPTLSIYYEPQEFSWPEEPPDTPEPTAIPGFNLLAIFAVISAIVPIQIIKRRKEKKQF